MSARSLGSDRLLVDDGQDVDPSGSLASPEDTLLQWVATAALLDQGDLPENLGFGAGIMSSIVGGLQDAGSPGEKLRGQVINDERIANASSSSSVEYGKLLLPITVEALDETVRFTGPLTAEMIERIIDDLGDSE